MSQISLVLRFHVFMMTVCLFSVYTPWCMQKTLMEMDLIMRRLDDQNVDVSDALRSVCHDGDCDGLIDETVDHPRSRCRCRWFWRSCFAHSLLSNLKDTSTTIKTAMTMTRHQPRRRDYSGWHRQHRTQGRWGLQPEPEPAQEPESQPTQEPESQPESQL